MSFSNTSRSKRSAAVSSAISLSSTAYFLRFSLPNEGWSRELVLLNAHSWKLGRQEPSLSDQSFADNCAPGHTVTDGVRLLRPVVERDAGRPISQLPASAGARAVGQKCRHFCVTTPSGFYHGDELWISTRGRVRGSPGAAAALVASRSRSKFYARKFDSESAVWSNKDKTSDKTLLRTYVGVFFIPLLSRRSIWFCFPVSPILSWTLVC